ncbi:hypothetical protein ACFS5N_03165 [Mucilaginibacter ximonensis]|uniref:YhhN-like protein n=1 Tax=Mucilaginibacter ximonensis TaxID=538021 RepID=A0ABW5Y7X7_9SPHI
MLKTFSLLYESYVVPGATLLPIIAGLIYYKRLSKAIHALIVYLGIALLINIVGIVMANHNINNMPLLHIYTLFELLAVMWYYKRAFNTQAAATRITVLMVVYSVLCVLNFTFFQSIYQFNTYTRPLEAIIVVVTGCIYLSVLGNADSKDSVNNAGRWITGGFLLYFCSSFFQFVFSNVISHHASKSVKFIIWNLHDTFVLIMYIFFFVAIRYEASKR